MDFGTPWDQLWNHFGDFFVIRTTQFVARIPELVFVVIWDWTWHQDATPGCIQNIVNTMVFVRFAIWEKFEF